MPNVIDLKNMFSQLTEQNKALRKSDKEIEQERIRLITLLVKRKYRFWAYKNGKSVEEQEKKIQAEIKDRIENPSKYLED